MKKYHIYGKVGGTKYLGTVKAVSETEALENADEELGHKMTVDLCHQCASQVDGAEIYEIEAEEDEE